MKTGLLALLLWTGAAQAGQVRHAIVVGANDGGGVLEPLRYAERDAEQMGNLLLELGGFDEQSVTVLYAPSDAVLRRALAQHANLSEQYEDDLFLFYYSGHADAQGLRLGNERYYFEALKHDVRAVDSDLSIGILDACRSGSITRLKGASVSESIFHQAVTTEGEAWLTASSADEVAQESDVLRGGFFSHYLQSGMRGAADTNDGVVDLEELYRYTAERVIAHTGATAAGAQHPHFSRNLDGHGVIGLTDLRNASARIELPSGVGGEVSVLRLPDRIQIAELNKDTEVRMYLAVPPGRYLIRRRDQGKLYEMSAGVSDGAEVVVSNWGAARIEGGLVRGEPRTDTLFDQSQAYEAKLNLGSSPTMAGGASLVIPGAGQMYNGQVWKGIAYFAATGTVMSSLLSGSDLTSNGVVAMLGISLWGASVADAVYNVHRNEEDRPSRGATLSAGAGFHGSALYPHHIGLSGDLMLGQGFSIGVDRVGYTPYAEGGWDAAVGSRFMVALREGRRWRPAGFMTMGYRHGQAPGGTALLSRLVFGGGANIRYYPVPRYFTEIEARWEQNGIEGNLGAGVMLGVHLGR
jgi:hypothetical protein